MNIPDYKLSAVLFGHSLDVRCVATSRDDCILSSSRDRTAKLWCPESVKDFTNVVTYKGHSNFVSSVCWVQPCERFPEGLVVTASNDQTILGYNLQDAVVQFTLEGHKNVVCFVTGGRTSGLLLSSSWDNTAKVWNINKSPPTATTLEGHQAAVWSVIELGNGGYATASADKTIILWNRDGAQLKVLTGHTDCVRSLVYANNESFMSCSNDTSIRHWTNVGECLNTYYGHSNYIYSITMNPALSPQCFVTCGEDGAVRVWNGGECIRILTLPAQSVWGVTCLGNGDIVTGSSDGVVRVFTCDPARYETEAVLKKFDDEVEKMVAASQKEIGGFKLTELPGPEVLLEPGKANGQTKIVRRGDSVKCYAWSAADHVWNEVGDVMGTPPAAEGKTLYQGKEYDYVFSVDITDGAPPIKLPFNKTEDPWVAAQAFIHKNDLPQVYLEQVANFIVKNANLDALPAPSDNGPADPLTGASRYVPGAGPGAGTGPGSPSRGARDPFTGAGSYVPPDSRSYIPHDTYLRFDQANLKAIRDKLKEFIEKTGDSGNPISDEQLDNVVKLGELNAKFVPETIEILQRLLQWPKDILFPVLDITRLAIRNKDVNKHIFESDNGPTLIKFLISLITDSVPANQMLALRALTNAFSDFPGEMLVISNSDNIAHVLLCLSAVSNNAQIAASSLLLNLAVALANETDISDLTDCLIQMLGKITDKEAYFRALVALGTLLVGSPNKVVIKTKIATNVFLNSKLKQDANLANDSDANVKKIAACSQQILQLL